MQATLVLTGGTWKVSTRVRDGGEMRAWLMTPVALAIVRVSVLFDAGVAVAGDRDGQNTYAKA